MGTIRLINYLMAKHGNIWNVHKQLKVTIPITQQGEICDIYSIRSRAYCKQTSKCWNCQGETNRTNLLFCNSCGSLQDPPDKDINYFKFLSLSSDFSINTAELTKKFRELQNLVHPDKYGNRIEREQTNSQQWSSILNKAYKTLLIPMERGQYILKLNGLSIPQDNSSLDKIFLMEMMERNEEIEEANENNISELLRIVQQDLENETKKLSECFDNGDFEGAKYILVKMKYFKSLEKSIYAKQEKFGYVATRK